MRTSPPPRVFDGLIDSCLTGWRGLYSTEDSRILSFIVGWATQAWSDLSAFAMSSTAAQYSSAAIAIIGSDCSALTEHSRPSVRPSSLPAYALPIHSQ